MIWLLALAVGAAVAAGVYLALSRQLLRAVVGVSIVAAAVNLVVLAVSRPGGPTPPIIPDGARSLDPALDPLPQALVLTAIVIGLALTCFSLVLALALQQRTGSSDSHALRAAEPPPTPDGMAALEPEHAGGPDAQEAP